MSKCPICNKVFSDDTKFCDSCGAQVVNTIFCPNCGKENKEGGAFCEHCGSALNVAQTTAAADVAAEAPVAVETPVATEVPAEPVVKKAKKLPKKAVMFGAIGLAAVAIIVILIALLSGGSSKAQINDVIYIKDKELFVKDLKSDDDGWQLTSNLTSGSSIEDSNLYSASYRLAWYTTISEDGKYIFYPDKIDDNSDGCTIYFKELGDSESEAIKIDSDITAYSVDEDTSVVTYLKGDYDSGATLYQYDISDDNKEKVASDVTGYYISEDASKIIYTNVDSSVYLKKSGEDKEKLASEIDGIQYVSEDLSTVYYTKESSLYKQVVGEEKVKIADDIYAVEAIYESGEIYYGKLVETEATLWDFVNDDLAESDAAMVEPVYPEYPEYPDYPDRPYSFEYDSYDEYEAAYELYQEEYNKINDAYQAAKDAYYDAQDVYWDEYYAYEDKLDRDTMREDLKEETITKTTYTLCYYDGTAETVLSENYDYYSADTADEAAVIYYDVINEAESGKINISEFSYMWEVRDFVEYNEAEGSEQYIAVNGTATLINTESNVSFDINTDGTIVYYIDNIPEDKEYGTLYRIEIKDGVVGTPEEYDTEVYTGYNYFIDDSKFMYLKDYKDGAGELYIDKTMIDYDVTSYSVEYDEETGNVYYGVDVDSETNVGTLKVYKDGEAVKISDDVIDMVIYPNGRVLYLYDYSTKSYKGELHQWNDGESTKIDDDVVAILPLINSMYKGW